MIALHTFWIWIFKKTPTSKTDIYKTKFARLSRAESLRQSRGRGRSPDTLGPRNDSWTPGLLAPVWSASAPRTAHLKHRSGVKSRPMSNTNTLFVYFSRLFSYMRFAPGTFIFWVVWILLSGPLDSSLWKNMPIRCLDLQCWMREGSSKRESQKDDSSAHKSVQRVRSTRLLQITSSNWDFYYGKVLKKYQLHSKWLCTDSLIIQSLAF